MFKLKEITVMLLDYSGTSVDWAILYSQHQQLSPKYVHI